MADDAKTDTFQMPPKATPESDVETDAMAPSSTNSLPVDKVQVAGPVEGGWGWMVVLGSALTFVLTFGLDRGFTLIHQELLVRYGASESDTALVYSLYIGMLYLAGPIGGVLCRILSLRKVMIFAGISSCAGLLGGAYAKSLSGVYLTLGVLTGFGIGICDIVEYVILCQYFEKRRGLALGVATMGIDMGGLTVTPLIAVMLNYYSYQSTMLIIGGLFLNIFVSAALFRALRDNYPWRKSSRQIKNTLSYYENVKSQGVNSAKDKCKLYGDISETKTENVDALLSKSSSSLQKGMGSSNSGKCDSRCSLLCTSMKERLGLRLFKNITFLMFLLHVCGVTFARNFQFVFLAGLADEKGLTRTETVGILMVFCAINSITRPAMGYLFDRPIIRSRVVVAHAVVGAGFCLAMYSVTFASHKAVLYISWACLEALLATHHTQVTNALSHVVGLENVTNAIGLLRLFQGICSILAPLIGGYIRDVTGNYYLGYLCGASVAMFSVVTFLIFYCCHQRTRQALTENNVRNSNGLLKVIHVN